MASVWGEMRKHTPHSKHGRHQRQADVDMEKAYQSMEKGHNVVKINLLKKADLSPKKMCLNSETRQILLYKVDQTRSAPVVLDLRYVKEVHTLDFKYNTVQVGDKWTRDKELRMHNPQAVLVISHGHAFNLSYWILIFESADAARLWCSGIHALMMDTVSASQTVIMERWLKKQFNNLSTSSNSRITMRHMKPYAQTTLQCKVPSKFLQDLIKDQMNFEEFAAASKALIHYNCGIFPTFFSMLSDDGQQVAFPSFIRFLKEMQSEELGKHREKTAEYLRRYLNDHSRHHNSMSSPPNLSIDQFCDYLFSRENSIWDSMNERMHHDMDRPLSHFWIASSHNTYLTGDQLRSESSLDSYSRALLMGCRCIELDCWDGQRKSNSQEVQDIVIYHGYTITSKLLLRDVLHTIRHYAFINSELPVILSIEDNCSVPAQRLLAQDIREILGDLLLTSPVSKEETELPSPASLKRKIIIKHKKLPVESEDLKIKIVPEEIDSDILERECVKRGILLLRNNLTNEWTPHVFVLFMDRLCYVTECFAENDKDGRAEDAVSVTGEEDTQEETLSGFGVRPEEMHVTEEWFHGKSDRQVAVTRLLEHRDKGNGVFLVRDSTIFIGDYSLSFLHEGQVYHCRIKTKMVDGEKKYYFLENITRDTLYELICYYMTVSLTTPNFSTRLLVPCPQPQPHLNQPWFSATATKKSAEELLSRVPEDGAFLIRYSSTDQNVFVISLRVDGDFWHYRLKRNGRIFVVNQTVFENLNQIVDYYSTRDFVRGISLKFPVNERDIDQFAHNYPEWYAPNNGCYMDINTLDQEVQARALRPYTAQTEEELTFPANATITVLRKEEHLWRGKYEGKVGWFPPTFVQEVKKNGKDSVTDGPSYQTIELAGAIVERIAVSGDIDKPHALRITHANAHWSGQQWIVAASSLEDADDWLNQMQELLRTVNDKIFNLRTREKNLRIAAELSNLVVYCQAVPFDPTRVRDGCFYEMCSFSESKLDKLLEKGLVSFNCRQLSRVYPQGSRITSANFNPVPMWNAGCHMVALNYQTGDKSMQLNQGKFMANGRCGYVLKPSYMLDDNFDPLQGNKVTSSCPVLLEITIIAGRHLSRKDKNKGICSPYVEVEVIGLPCDDDNYKTCTIASNGLNPQWNESVTFKVQCPEVALLRFAVEDGDFVGPNTDPFIGQAVFPMDCIRCGFRSVALKNQFSEELELSSLLVHVAMTPMGSGETLTNPHSVLQANRSVYANGRSQSLPLSPSPPGTVRLSNTRVASLDVPPGINAPSAARPRNSTNADDSSSQQKKKNKFKKLFSFGRKECE